MQDVREILLAEHGLAGVQALLMGTPAQEMVRGVLAGMLGEGCRPGALRLQRAKFKPSRASWSPTMTSRWTLRRGRQPGDRGAPAAALR